MHHITFVKKLLPNGAVCPKCQELHERLVAESLIQYVNQILIADENDYSSPGQRLARQHNVETAPFFVVDDGDQVHIFSKLSHFKHCLTEQEIANIQASEL